MQINHLSAGRVPEGATVERAVPTPLNQGSILQLDLNSSDFNTAREVVEQIVANLRAKNYGFRTLVHEVVQSKLFRCK